MTSSYWMQPGPPAFPDRVSLSNRRLCRDVQCRMATSHAIRTLRRLVPALVIVATVAGVHAQNAQQDAADTQRLTKAMDVKPGSVIGEIGAGGGELTVAMARVVGDTGRVYSNELNKDRLAAIQKTVDAAGLKNVTMVEGKEDVANLPDACCDGIFMRSVYHHFGDPASMNASLRRALKPGGRLVVIDFTPPPPSEKTENPPGHRGEDNHHGITAETLAKELTDAGFEVVTSETSGRSVFVVARRPSG